ncbi:UDP-N-acetylmuramate--L-alanine ligase [Limimonas halophila]|uniref:UDP-N-acetylmuramate--L-alanine ligase n=1 Tax=Limimonas halophila TaxID=1082479 RepID=A0A1G7U521_9PROT|nr:UDP-N-acetylmuramate--L-alanine ligase [Limimonas halophila]SDG42722.1 UDP-N-acetylmuramate--L-alanine ligase [Limimonas halophila]
MKHLPLDIGLIHFVGIGGIGMSGIAEILHNLGYRVQGSDLSESAGVRRLRALGIPVSVGHAAENLADAEVVVVSAAVKSDNPEVAAARERRLPVVRRAEMLGELMRLKGAVAVGGTHGKTTTTSMVAALMDAAGLDPTVINGGIINAYGTNARLGDGDWMVVEADESDGSFTKLPATVAVVTNIDPEHLDHFGSEAALHRAFEQFVENIPFYGFAVLCVDHPQVQTLVGRVRDRRVVTYGFGTQADVRAENLSQGSDGASFTVVFSERTEIGPARVDDVRLPMLGRHNVSNALAAITVATELGLDAETLRRAFSGFSGVKRRFTTTGVVDGVTVIDDYGHHPVEIASVLSAARNAGSGRVLAVVQPHRYTRLSNLFNDFCTCFNDADTVVVAPVYPAGEDPLPGVTHTALAAGLREHGHRRVLTINDPEELARLVDAETAAGDTVVCLGAGSITQWAQALPYELERLHTNGRAAGGGS